MRIRTYLRGTIFILLGVMLLANNFQILPWSVWYELLRLWPAILIAIGVDLIFRKSSLSFLQILSPLVIIAAIGGAVYLSQADRAYEITDRALRFEQPLSPKLKQADIEISFGAGILRLEGGSAYLFEGDFTTPSWLRPKMRYRVVGEKGFLELTEEGERGRFQFSQLGKEYSWNLRLNNEIPLTLKIETGASSNYLDISSLEATYLELKAGVSKNEIKFGSLSSIQAKIEAGVSRIKLFI
ncbi:unnamed protein product, partial [marine sediment metagenome]